MARLTDRGSRIICRGCEFDVTDAGRKSLVEKLFCVKFKLEFEVND